MLDMQIVSCETTAHYIGVRHLEPTTTHM